MCAVDTHEEIDQSGISQTRVDRRLLEQEHILILDSNDSYVPCV
jgi:hypothetical protein